MRLEPPSKSEQDASRAGLYRAFAPVLERILQAKGASHDDARDAVQDAFVALVAHDIDIERDPHGWLVTVARNSLRDRERRQRTRTESKEDLAPPPEPRCALDRTVDARRLFGRVAELVLELPEAHREALLACRVDGSSSAEAVRTLKASSAASVRQQVHRAVERICAELERAAVACPWCGGD